MELTQWINSIEKKEYSPFGLPPAYSNEKVVTVWTLRGDGNGDFEEVSERATPEVIEDYLKYLKRQERLAKEYLEELTERTE